MNERTYLTMLFFSDTITSVIALAMLNNYPHVNIYYEPLTNFIISFMVVKMIGYYIIYVGLTYMPKYRDILNKISVIFTIVLSLTTLYTLNIIKSSEYGIGEISPDFYNSIEIMNGIKDSIKF